MGPSVALHYASKVKEAQKLSETWSWPCRLRPIDTEPDERLISGHIPGLSASIEQSSGNPIEVAVRAVSSHDLVLKVHDPSLIDVRGQVVHVTLFHQADFVARQVPCVLHWRGNIDGECVIGLFSVEEMVGVSRWQSRQARQGIRYPVDMNCLVEVAEEEFVSGTIVDYSLNGCRFVAQKDIAIDRTYTTRVLLGNSTVDVHLHPRWVQRTADGLHMGCSFNKEEGVLLACRHHAQPTGLTLDLRPATSDWNPDRT